MPSGILQNKLIVLPLIVVIIASVIVVIDRINVDPIKSISEPGPRTKNYQGIKDDIAAFQQKSWNKFDYNDIKNRIEESAKPNPTPLISESQKTELIANLDASYLVLLKAAIGNFCRTADPLIGDKDDLKGELAKLPPDLLPETVNGLTASLNLFKSAKPLDANIDGFVEIHPYEPASAESYTARINTILHADNLKDNPYLTRLLTEDSRELAELKTHADLFTNICTYHLLDSTYDCGKFLPNKFYYNKCKLRDCQ